MNKIDKHQNIIRFEQQYTAQAKIDKIALQRHKICAILTATTAVIFAAALIASTPAIILTAGITSLSIVAIIVSTVVLGLFTSIAYLASKNSFSNMEELKTKLTLHFLDFISFNLDEETFSRLNLLSQYGLISKEIAEEIIHFQEKVKTSQIFTKGFWVQYNSKPNEERINQFHIWENLQTEWISIYRRIQEEAPFPALESAKPIPLYGNLEPLKSLDICNIEITKETADQICNEAL